MRGAGGAGHGLTGRTTVGKLPGFLAVDLGRIKPFHEALRYGYAVGRIRVLESQLITSHRLERLIEADFEEALQVLDEVPLGDFLVDAQTPREVDEGLTAFLRDVYASIEEALPGDSHLPAFFLCRYDFHNLKALLKAGVGETAEGLLPGLGTIDPMSLRKGMENPATLPSPYRETVQRCFELDGSPGDTDGLVDRFYLEYRLDLARREGSAFIVDFARASIDLANLKQVIRGRGLGRDRAFLEDSLARGGFIATGQLTALYEDDAETVVRKLEGSRYYSGLFSMLEASEDIVGLTGFDRASDDRLMDMLRATKRISIGSEPIFAYVRARENEVMTVRIILMAKLNNISPETIEKSLRKLYIE